MYGLYGCETWSVRLTEKQGMKDFGNRVLKEKFWCTSDKVIEMRIKLPVDKLRNLYINDT